MYIYLASRYSRRLELCDYRDQLTSLGHVVTSVWLNGGHQLASDGTPIGEDGVALVDGSRFGDPNYSDDAAKAAAVLRDKFAADDFRDVLSCNLCICFTEEPRSDKGRGGRHVEMGIALGAMKRVWVVGPRENIFCWLEDVTNYTNFQDALWALRKEGRG